MGGAWCSPWGGGDPTVLLVLRGAQPPPAQPPAHRAWGHGENPQGCGPSGMCPPVGVAFWGVALLGTRPLGCGPLGHGPAAGCVPIKGLAEAVVVPVLRLGGPTGRAGELSHQGRVQAPPPLGCHAPLGPAHLPHPFNWLHPLLYKPRPLIRHSCSFIGRCSGPCSQSGASAGGGQRTGKGPLGGRAVTTQGGDNTTR